MITLDFDKLYKDEMIQFIPFNEIQTVETSLRIKMAYNTFESQYYHGQWDKKTNAPNGLGLAISRKGEILEGLFHQSQLTVPYIRMATDDDYTIVLESGKDGMIYEIHFESFSYAHGKSYDP